jgi:hypothetical protein
MIISLGLDKSHAVDPFLKILNFPSHHVDLVLLELDFGLKFLLLRLVLIGAGGRQRLLLVI